MKQEILLRNYEYSIFPSMLIPTAQDTKHSHNLSDNKPLAEVKLDFENGCFRMDADWHFILTSNKHAEQSWVACHKERIKVEASIYPSQVINLALESNDGLIFALDGTLLDGNSISICSGFLVLDNVTKNRTITNEWSFTFYVYDATNDECEIMLKLPMHIYTIKGESN